MRKLVWKGTTLYSKGWLWDTKLAHLEPVVIVGGYGWSKVLDWWLTVRGVRGGRGIHASFQETKEIAEREVYMPTEELYRVVD